MTDPAGQYGPNPSNAGKQVSLEDSRVPEGESALPMPDDEEGDANRSDRSGSGSSTDTRGRSTGLETMLGKVFVERGYVTPDELEACRQVQRRRTDEEDPVDLAELLIENAYITRRQYQRMRSEVEAEKSTQQIPGFKILKKLGSGAMATVFLARQLSLDRLVAIKVLPAKFSSNEKFIERFYKEGRAAAQLNHPNIVAAYDVGQSGDHHYFVMEYVDGDTVYDRIVKRRRVEERDAIEIIRQTARALEHAHAKGFIHRDVKPKNIMITSGSVVKLADLGLARAVSDKEAAEQEAGRAYGTPYYISPEQIRGEMKIDGRADIYGLGATFYHIVAGRVPFEGKNPSAVMHKHLKQALTPPDHLNPKLSADTAMVIEMMMAKSRKKRYQNVSDLLVDLDAISRGEKPHFAQAQSDLTGLSKIEEEAASVYAEPAVLAPTRRRDSAMNSPAFLVVAVVAMLSVIANLILLAMVLSPSGDRSPRDSGAITTRVGPGAANSLTGAWSSSELDGTTFAGVKTVQLALYSNGDGSLVRWFDAALPEARMFSWNAREGRINLQFSEGMASYTYSLAGDTLTMNRIGGDRARMILRRE